MRSRKLALKSSNALLVLSTFSTVAPTTLMRLRVRFLFEHRRVPGRDCLKVSRVHEEGVQLWQITI